MAHAGYVPPIIAFTIHKKPICTESKAVRLERLWSKVTTNKKAKGFMDFGKFTFISRKNFLVQSQRGDAKIIFRKLSEENMLFDKKLHPNVNGKRWGKNILFYFKLPNLVC